MDSDEPSSTPEPPRVLAHLLSPEDPHFSVLPVVDLTPILRDRKQDINTNSTIQKLLTSENFEKIPTPARILVGGPTMSGKSHFISKLVKYREQVFDQKFVSIIYCLPSNSFHLHSDFIHALRESCEDIPVKIVEGMPNIEELALDMTKEHKLLILDDLMQPAFNSKSMLDLMTSQSHHANITVVVTTQNIFIPSKYGKTVTRNCSTKVIFWDHSDVQLLGILSSKMFPKKSSGFLLECFEWMYKNEGTEYIVIDSSPVSLLSRQMKVRTNIFPKSEGLEAKPIFFFPADDE